jgi:CheY-like chemotaxis protein
MHKSPKILIVEPERIIAMDIHSILNNNGYTSTTMAYSEKEALKKLEESAPDLVFWDVMNQKGRDGLKAGRRINKRYKIPVVYLLSMPGDQATPNELDGRSFRFITKPFNENDITATVSDLIKPLKRNRG